MDLPGILFASAVVLILSWGFLAALWRTFATRDDIYSGVAPGVIPPDAMNAPVESIRRRRVIKGPNAVRFTPPEVMQPWMLGVAGADNTLRGKDLGSMFMQLAVLGFFRIRKDGPPRRVVFTKKQEWLLERAWTPPSVALAPAQVMLLDTIFRPGEHSVRLSSVTNRIRARAKPLQKQAKDDTRTVLGKGRNGRGLAAHGTANHVQALGFGEYLRTAEAGQIRFEEAAGIFTRYLPWAITFGVADRWASVFQQVVANAAASSTAIDGATLSSWGSDLSWFGDLDIGALGSDLGSFGDGMTDLSSSLGDLGASLSDAISDMTDSVDSMVGDIDSSVGDAGGGDSGGGGDGGDGGGGGGD